MFGRKTGAIFAVLLVCALAAPGAIAAPETGSWTIDSSPNSEPLPTKNTPSAVTCVSASDCWSVGSYDRAGVNQTLIQRWNGSAWTVVASPNTNAAQQQSLRTASCVTATACWAVGTFNDGDHGRTLTMRWNGSAWAIVASPDGSATGDNFLSGIDCTSVSSCWAVGSYSAANGSYQSLAMRWNGSAWSIVGSPNSSATQSTFVNGVTCVSSTDCWAIGSSTNGNLGERTFVARWNGTTWAIVTSPNNGAGHNGLYDATCVSASDCTAVGYATIGNTKQTLIVRWNGTAWALSLSANSGPTTNNFLRGVSCSSAADCWAVGHDESGAGYRSLVLRWDGTQWNRVTTPTIQGSNRLSDVRCVSSTDCWAVGSATTATFEQTLIERWNGSSWSIVSAEDARSDTHNTLLGVTCVSDVDCWAVASYNNGTVQQTLIERYDGSTWRIVPSPNTSTTRSNILYDVACASATDCWAVGYAIGTGAFQTLTLRWNGSVWSIVPSPSVSLVQNNFLNDVTCVSSSDCWAVGFYDTGSVYRTLTMRWDGVEWTIVSSPDVEGSPQSRLYGVTCVSTSDCWAVGRYTRADNFIQTLIMRWNGSVWAIVASPNTSESETQYLWNATCVTSTDCWAVGSYSPGGGTGLNLIQHWDGVAWSIVNAPNPVAPYNYVFPRNIACADASECWAVGYYSLAGVNRTMTLRWDGSEWAVASSPNSSATQNNVLVSVSCVPGAACVTAGYSTDDGGVFRTLIQRRRPANRAPTARVTVSAPTGPAPITVTLDASASSDPDRWDAITTYRFTPGDGSSTVTQAASRLQHTYVQPGLFTASVIAVDGAGLESVAATSTPIRVSSPPPVIVTPTQGAAISSATVSITGTSQSSVNVQLFEGANLVGTTTSDAAGQWTMSTTLADGPHEMTARLVEADGSMGPASLARTFVVDTVAPGAPTIVTPVQGAMIAESFVTVSGTAESGARVSVFRAGLEVSVVTASAQGAWSAVLNLPAGAHVVTATQADVAGNAGPATAPRNFSTDPAGTPTQVLSPAEHAVVSKRDVLVVGKAAPNAEVDILDATSGVRLQTAVAGESGWWSVSIRFSDGLQSIRAIQPANGAVSADRSFAVSSAAPVITSPVDGSAVRSPFEIAGASRPGATVTVREGAMTLGTATADDAGWWSLDASMADGAHAIVAHAGAEPQRTEDSATVRFVVDSSGPSVSARVPSWLMGSTAGTPVTVSGTAIDASSVITELTISYVNAIGTVVAGAPTCNGCGTVREISFVDSPTLSPGRWTAVIRARDSLGNTERPTSISFVVLA